MSERCLRCAARLLPLIALVGVCLACAPSVPVESKGESTPSTTATETPSAPSAPAEIGLKVVDRAKYDEVIAGLNGKVVLVDFWATWCGPCVQQFPHTVELSERLADKGLAVVAVSFDDPSDLQPIRQFLAARGADHVINVVNQYGLGQEAIVAFEIESGALPSYKLYDRNGRLRKTFETDPLAKKQFTPQDIEVAVEELLAE